MSSAIAIPNANSGAVSSVTRSGISNAGLSSLSIARSGMSAAQRRLAVAAYNLAHLDAEDFRRVELDQTASPEGGVVTTVSRSAQPGPSPAVDFIGLLVARNHFLANLAVFRASYYRIGSLLDIAV